LLAPDRSTPLLNLYVIIKTIEAADLFHKEGRLPVLARYSTVRDYGSQEIVIKKSRFIGHARPVESEDEAVAFIEELKKKFWDATHNCSAYLIGERDQFQKALDDGEPSGTAGKQIL
jgi:putative IMPACT (imprinted ancient) family translation regulator